MRRLTILALVLAVWSCGGDQEKADELRKYASSMKQLESLNKQVAETLTRLNEPSYKISKEDLDTARRLVDSYVAAIEKVERPTWSQLRRVYDNYLTKLKEAQNIAVDTGRELGRERGNVGIALREIEKTTKRHYKSGIDLLWGRQNIVEEMPLKWPKTD